VSAPNRRISWEAVHERLRAATAAIESALAPSQERIAAVHRERAKRLARRTRASVSDRTITALVFRIGQERYAVEAAELAEVRRNCPISRLPGGAGQLAGVAAVRGEIRPIWHLGRLLGVESAAFGGTVLLLRAASGSRGVLVDEVEGISTIDLAQCQPASRELRHARAIAPGSVIILDTQTLFHGHLK
jgi:purine-binding chemotaxis protein CheW